MSCGSVFEGCASCKGRDQCDGCIAELFYQDGGRCVSCSTLDGCVKCTDSKTCTECLVGFKPKDGVCLAC